jgi:hypothetical protein
MFLGAQHFCCCADPIRHVVGLPEKDDCGPKRGWFSVVSEFGPRYSPLDRQVYVALGGSQVATEIANEVSPQGKKKGPDNSMNVLKQQFF